MATIAKTPIGPSWYDSRNRITNSTYAGFDEAGNQTFDAPYTLSYDAEGRTISATSAGNNNATYFYDGDGRSVKTVVNGVTTVFVYDAFGQLAAEYGGTAAGPGGATYLTQDNLGSTRLTTNGSGADVRRFDFRPFGQLISPTDQSGNCQGPRAGVAGYCLSEPRQMFTGKERDGETGLDYFGARYLAAAQGRFTSVDPLMASADPAIPESWNRYSYVLNNPLTFVDPTGELWVASGEANNPYRWVDTCGQGQTCYESRAAVVGGNLSVYGSRNAQDISTYQANARGLVNVVDVSAQHDAQFVSQQTPGRQENYLAPAQAAALFNAAGAYHAAYPSDEKLVFTGGSTAEGVSAIPNRQSHRGGLNIDLRYMDSKGRSLQGDVVDNADILRMGTLFSLFAGQHAGLGAPITGNAARFGLPAHTVGGHRDHIHFQRTYPRRARER